MSGHSKWSTIKHKKAAADDRKGKEFSRYARLIAVESRLACGDTRVPALKALIDKAKAANMPKENIERAVQKGLGPGAQDAKTVVYELYGPGGVALLIDTVTDNRNRTVAELKHLVSKQGCQLAEPGGAAWAFRKKGVDWTAATTVPISPHDNEQLQTLIAVLEEHGDVERVYTNAA